MDFQGYSGPINDTIQYKIAVMKWFAGGGEVGLTNKEHFFQEPRVDFIPVDGPSWNWKSYMYAPMVKKEVEHIEPYTIENLPNGKTLLEQNVIGFEYDKRKDCLAIKTEAYAWRSASWMAQFEGVGNRVKTAKYILLDG